VLFLCTGNGSRSQLAEALAQRRSGGLVQAFSAGSHPRSLHPNTVRVLAEHGIDVRGRAAKHLTMFAADRFGYVITLCDRVREVCPEFPGHPRHIHWSIPDPAAAGDTDEASYPAFQATAAELEARIGFLLAAIAATPARSAHQEA
jgi:protein-tyrosine-phosphatase